MFVLNEEYIIFVLINLVHTRFLIEPNFIQDSNFCKISSTVHKKYERVKLVLLILSNNLHPYLQSISPPSLYYKIYSLPAPDNHHLPGLADVHLAAQLLPLRAREDLLCEPRLQRLALQPLVGGG